MFLSILRQVTKDAREPRQRKLKQRDRAFATSIYAAEPGSNNVFVSSRGRTDGYLHSFPVTLCVWNISSTSHANAGNVRMRSDPCEWQSVLKREAVRMSECQGCDVTGFRS